MNYSCRLINAVNEAKKLEELFKKFKSQSVCNNLEGDEQYQKDCDDIRWGILRVQNYLGSFQNTISPENLRKEEIILNYLESKVCNKIDTIQCEMSDYVDVMREQEVNEHVCNNIKDFQKDVVAAHDLFQEFAALHDEIKEIKTALKD